MEDRAVAVVVTSEASRYVVYLKRVKPSVYATRAYFLYTYVIWIMSAGVGPYTFRTQSQQKKIWVHEYLDGGVDWVGILEDIPCPKHSCGLDLLFSSQEPLCASYAKIGNWYV